MKDDFDYGRIEWNVIDRNIQYHYMRVQFSSFSLTFFFFLFFNWTLFRFLITVSQTYFSCILWLFKIDVF